MKIRALFVTLSGLSAAAVAVLVLAAVPAPAGAIAQPVGPAMPEECVCSRGLRLAEAPPSVLHNCQCGPLQCVVHAQSGQLQCR
ncbi:MULTISPECIES: hypothetical protein [Thauera]|jgi:hypothetical protein|uniref:Uncharacterized protein n=2 Tax=Thauera aminoaromatica TaxID=164330 RepID=C4ZKP8_THASP|nr:MULTISPECIES: hypothetical protein [Thauera]ACK54565.1 hypothetical protein Tmz1t_1813 [Thauera aminoaromatica]ENO84869.1 hypothetical protein C665_11999 [Thauera aminoaromatica S2]MBL8462162.1 hypothetical protein [Thauera sp.]MBP6130838.1 hypothetical protein [Thauera sp.]MBP7047083.1 hypothetical protein [Thauera sp.]